MITAIAMAVMLAGAPDAGVAQKQKPLGPGPSAAETAKLYFLAGDLQKAQEWAQRGLKKEPKTCGPLNKAIAEYAFLANHIDEFTPAEAKSFLDFDRKISPTVRGKITEKAFVRYVAHPLEVAKSRAEGDVPAALAIVAQVLAVDPTNVDALAMQKSLKSGVDAGH